jgi:GntR family transcriptional regulator / MocR family aminotransferase
VVPAHLVDAVTDEKDLADCGTARIEQQAFASFLSRGELDRHLRRMRVEYRRRRDLLVEALGDALPEARIHGIAAGLHATVELDERAIVEQAHARRIDLTTMGPFWIVPGSGPPTLLVGYGQVPEPSINAAVNELAEAVRAARRTAPASRR